MTLAKIFCIEEVPNPANSVAMAEGDVVGVVLPSSNSIPVVSTNADSSQQLMKHAQSTTTSDLLSSEFTTITGSALHVYANLGDMLDPVETGKDHSNPYNNCNEYNFLSHSTRFTYN